MLLLLTVWIGMVLQANAFIQFAPFFQRLQCVGAVGQLTCNGRPSPNVPVRLIEEDSGIFDRDDLMSETRTDGAGFFRIYGCDEEILNITPKLNILHDCNDETTMCSLNLQMFIPYGYVNGKGPLRYYNFRTINLNKGSYTQYRDCIYTLFS